MNFLPRILCHKTNFYIKMSSTMSSISPLDEMIAKLGQRKLKKFKGYGNAATNTYKKKVGGKVEFDVSVDTRVMEMLARNGPSDAATEMWDISIMEGKFPSKKTMSTLCAHLSSEGNYSKIETVAHLCKISFPEEHALRGGYRHYIAEALWKTGRYEDAIALFQELFHTNEHIRHKVANMSKFLIAQILKEQIHDLYPLLAQYAGSCMKLGNFTVAANLWSCSFESEHYEVQQLAEKLLQDHPQLLNSISKKIPGIMNRAQNDGNLAVFQRLIQFTLSHNLHSHQTPVFSTYLEYLCDLEDVGRATTTFEYICNYKIRLPATTVEKFTRLMLLKKQRIPFILIGNENNKPVKFQF